MEIKVTSYVEVTLRDKEGNIIAQDCGPTAVTELSNNILMDAILPRLGTSASPTAVPARAAATGINEPVGKSAKSDEIFRANYVS